MRTEYEQYRHQPLDLANEAWKAEIQANAMARMLEERDRTASLSAYRSYGQHEYYRPVGRPGRLRSWGAVFRQIRMQLKKFLRGSR